MYRSDWATVVLGDARTALLGLATESADLVVTDPPYGREWRSNQRNERFEQMIGDDAGLLQLLAEVTPELVRVTRRTRHIYTFGHPLTHDLLPAKARTELIWDKTWMGGGDLSSSWGPAHEPIYLHVRAADATNARRGAGSLAAKLRRGSIVRVPRLNANQVKRHPTEKPVALLRQLIESSSLLGNLVLDPFAGSGSTGVAALLEGRRAYLIEIDEKYAQTAVQRVCEAERVMDMAVGL